MRNQKGKTALELMAELERDAQYRGLRNQRDEERRRKDEEYERAEAPLVKELQEAGVMVDSVWDLVNAPNRYIKSLPILLRHLQKPYPDAVREGIARAMAVPEANFAWPVLVKLYQNEQEGRTKDGLAVAISSIADATTVSELIRLARDLNNGRSRLLLLSALTRLPLAQARKALMEFGGDPQLYKEAQRILRKLG